MVNLGLNFVNPRRLLSTSPPRRSKLTRRAVVTRALLPNDNDPIARTFLRQPAVFAAGIVVGLLGIKIEQEPLKSWIETTAIAAGIPYTTIKDQADQRVMRQDESTAWRR